MAVELRPACEEPPEQLAAATSNTGRTIRTSHRHARRRDRDDLEAATFTRRTHQASRFWSDLPWAPQDYSLELMARHGWTRRFQSGRNLLRTRNGWSPQGAME